MLKGKTQTLKGVARNLTVEEKGRCDLAGNLDSLGVVEEGLVVLRIVKEAIFNGWCRDSTFVSLVGREVFLSWRDSDWMRLSHGVVAPQCPNQLASFFHKWGAPVFYWLLV